MKRWGFLFMSAALSAQGAESLHTVVDDAWNGAKGSHFSGRLTENHRVPEKASGSLASLYRNTRLLFTSGEEGVVTWRVGTMEWSVRADDDGYWELVSNQPLSLPPGWHPIEAVPAASSEAWLLIPDPRNTFGIISDIDDTIMVSEVLRTRMLLRNSLFVPGEKRTAVEGMAPLYRRLLQQNAAPEASPVFYVSSSPRQLTDNLRLFLRTNGYPRGVLQLKEIGSERSDSLRDHAAYKMRRIETIFAAYPETRFALFGDDGERDPEIFSALQAKYPAQIAEVWIRRVHTGDKRTRFEGQRDVAELLAEGQKP